MYRPLFRPAAAHPLLPAFLARLLACTTLRLVSRAAPAAARDMTKGRPLPLAAHALGPAQYLNVPRPSSRKQHSMSSASARVSRLQGLATARHAAPQPRNRHGTRCACTRCAPAALASTTPPPRPHQCAPPARVGARAALPLPRPRRPEAAGGRWPCLRRTVSRRLIAASVASRPLAPAEVGQLWAASGKKAMPTSRSALGAGAATNQPGRSHTALHLHQPAPSPAGALASGPRAPGPIGPRRRAGAADATAAGQAATQCARRRPQLQPLCSHHRRLRRGPRAPAGHQSRTIKRQRARAPARQRAVGAGLAGRVCTRSAAPQHGARPRAA